jgi:rhodanese-related sulfurtransferase
MSAINTISPDKLGRLVGIPTSPAIIDLRRDGDRRIPGSLRRPADRVAAWAPGYAGRAAVVLCGDGADESPGVAAWLRHCGCGAEILEGGFTAWCQSDLPTLDELKIPPRDADGRTVWITRARPKVDRIACPWLIRRFVDPNAVFLFVAASEISKAATSLNATAFDVEGVFWSHRGDLCTFDVMLEEFGLTDIEPLCRLATIVRGADTARPEIAPQAAGLLAVSLGLSRMFASDLDQLEAGMLIYDAFYRWCRDAVDENHDWVSHAPKKRRLE